MVPLHCHQRMVPLWPTEDRRLSLMSDVIAFTTHKVWWNDSLRSKNVFQMSSSNGQVAGPDTFARRYPSPTQCDFYGLGVTHQNTFTSDSVQHLSSVYCHLAKERCRKSWCWSYDPEMPSPYMLMQVLQLIAALWSPHPGLQCTVDSKTDEFSKKFQIAFDRPPPETIKKSCVLECTAFPKDCNKLSYSKGLPLLLCP